MIVAAAITLWLAIRSNDGLVADDYYKQGLAINQVTSRDRRAAELELRGEMSLDAGRQLVRVVLNGGKLTAMPGILLLKLSHPTRGGLDQSLNLVADGTGFYSGKLTAPLSGRWHVTLEDDKREWRLVGDWEVEKQSSLRLAAAAAAGSGGIHSDNSGR